MTEAGNFGSLASRAPSASHPFSARADVQRVNMS
jgi:hypothetical protein